MSSTAPDALPDEGLEVEAERIRNEYRRRAAEIPSDYYSLSRPGVLFAHQQRVRATIAMLTASQLMPLDERRILDIGCGLGSWLSDFESWGAKRSRLAGIDLDPVSATRAAERFCERRDDAGRVLTAGADIRIGDASSLPWPDGSFDIVVLSTVLSSILSANMRECVAQEAARVMAGNGAVLWYDFFVDNPSNPSVRGVRRAEIEALFPGFSTRLRRVTLAPPLARAVAPVTWLGAHLLERAAVFNTHYLGVLRPRVAGGSVS